MKALQRKARQVTRKKKKKKYKPKEEKNKTQLQLPCRFSIGGREERLSDLVFTHMRLLCNLDSRKRRSSSGVRRSVESTSMKGGTPLLRGPETEDSPARTAEAARADAALVVTTLVLALGRGDSCGSDAARRRQCGLLHSA